MRSSKWKTHLFEAQKAQCLVAMKVKRVGKVELRSYLYLVEFKEGLKKEYQRSLNYPVQIRWAERVRSRNVQRVLRSEFDYDSSFLTQVDGVRELGSIEEGLRCLVVKLCRFKIGIGSSWQLEFNHYVWSFWVSFMWF